MQWVTHGILSGKNAKAAELDCPCLAENWRHIRSVKQTREIEIACSCNRLSWRGFVGSSEVSFNAIDLCEIGRIRYVVQKYLRSQTSLLCTFKISQLEWMSALKAEDGLSASKLFMKIVGRIALTFQSLLATVEVCYQFACSIYRLAGFGSVHPQFVLHTATSQRS